VFFDFARKYIAVIRKRNAGPQILQDDVASLNSNGYPKSDVSMLIQEKVLIQD